MEQPNDARLGEQSHMPAPRQYTQMPAPSEPFVPRLGSAPAGHVPAVQAPPPAQMPAPSEPEYMVAARYIIPGMEAGTVPGQLVAYLKQMNKAQQVEIIKDAKERNPAVVGDIMDLFNAEKDAMRVAASANQFAADCAAHFASKAVVLNGGGTDGRAVIYDFRTGETQKKAAFIEKYTFLEPVAVEVVNKKGDPEKREIAAANYWYDTAANYYEAFGYDPAGGSIYDDPKIPGRVLVNTYEPPHERPAPAGQHVGPFLHLVSANFPNEDDQHVLLSALAFTVQYPAEMLQWAPVVQGAEGCGKGIMVRRTVEHCCGRGNVGAASPKTLAGDFNGYMHRKTVVVVDEIGEHGKAKLADIVESLKEPMVEPEIPFRLMRENPGKDRSFATWFFLTNHKKSMMVSKEGRRFAPLISALQTKDAVRDAFNPDMWAGYPQVMAAAGGPSKTWFKYYMTWWNMGGNEAVRGYLATYTAAEVGPAPETSARSEAVEAAEPEMVHIVREAVAAGDYGFRGGFVCAEAVRRLMASDGLKIPAGRWFGEGMRQAGFPYVVRNRPTLQDETEFGLRPSDRPRYYHSDPNLADAKGAVVVEAYAQAQAEGEEVVPCKVVQMPGLPK